jgi:hypothetical protein
MVVPTFLPKIRFRIRVIEFTEGSGEPSARTRNWNPLRDFAG